MMKLMNSMFSALLMYSRIPAPQVEWKEENRRYALCFFPLIGAVIGGLQLLLYWFCEKFAVEKTLYGAAAAAIPLLVTGGIHMDGFCDVVDARSSFANRERKLEIMADPHIGSFALMRAVLYFLFQFGFFCSLNGKPWAATIGYVLSRAFSGLAAVTFPCAKKQGSLQDFAEPAHRKITILVLSVTAVAAGAAMVIADTKSGVCAIAAALLVFWYYKRMSIREFGGITGDLAGYFLQLCELAILGAAAAVQILG